MVVFVHSLQSRCRRHLFCNIAGRFRGVQRIEGIRTDIAAPVVGGAYRFRCSMVVLLRRRHRHGELGSGIIAIRHQADAGKVLGVDARLRTTGNGGIGGTFEAVHIALQIRYGLAVRFVEAFGIDTAERCVDALDVRKAGRFGHPLLPTFGIGIADGIVGRAFLTCTDIGISINASTAS